MITPKEQNNFLVTNPPPKMEIYKLPGKEFKLIVLRKLRELPKNTDNSTISGKQNMKKKKTHKVQQRNRNH